MKMKEEKIEIETRKKELDIEEKYMKLQIDLQTKFHEKTVQLLEKHQVQFQETYQKIMERLPNVNMDITQSR